MSRWLSWRERWALMSRVKVRQAWMSREMRRRPAAFRRELVLSADGRRFGEMMQPWQARDFAVLDEAWRELAGNSSAIGGRSPEAITPLLKGGSARRRVWIERPRGHAKTSDMAVQIAWILLFAERRVEGVAAAADREQAELVWEAVSRLAQLNPLWCAGLRFQKHLVFNAQTGSRLEVISSDVQSSWGILPDFVICDELCHWEKPEMWFSLLSSAAKKPECVLVVLTNAGVGRGWQWEAREAARTSERWHFSSLEGPQAPWISEEMLAEQRLLLPRPVYARLWENRWQHSDGEFVTLEEAEACRDSLLTVQEHGEPGRLYVAAVDYAEKHDYTVGVVVHREGERIVVDRMDVVVPRTDAPVKVQWVEEWMRRIARRFQRVTFVVDEYQLLGTIQHLETKLDVRRFLFRGGRGNHELALALRKLILHREVAWYPACGQLEEAIGRDDLETELASLLLKQSALGWCRIDHRSDGGHHDDRSFALGAACLQLVREGAGEEWMEVAGGLGEW